METIRNIILYTSAGYETVDKLISVQELVWPVYD